MPARKQHGGRRPGAGPPNGNLNALKSGRYSQHVKALKLALQAIPRTADVIRRFDAAGDGKRALLARALEQFAQRTAKLPEGEPSTYAELILLGDPAAKQSRFDGQIDPAQIRRLIDIGENNQTINRVAIDKGDRRSPKQPRSARPTS